VGRIAATAVPLQGLVELASGAPCDDTDEFRASVLCAALHAASRCVQVYATPKCPSLPELIAPLREAAAVIDAQAFPPAVGEALASFTAAAGAAAEEAVAKRRPLVKAKAPELARSYNPKFEEDYARGADYDPDKERADAKRLKKQIKTEKRSAARELRKDNYFLAAERVRWKEEHDADRATKMKAAMSFLQKQESDMKSGGQGGMARKKKLNG